MRVHPVLAVAAAGGLFAGAATLGVAWATSAGPQVAIAPRPVIEAPPPAPPVAPVAPAAPAAPAAHALPIPDAEPVVEEVDPGAPVACRISVLRPQPDDAPDDAEDAPVPGAHLRLTREDGGGGDPQPPAAVTVQAGSDGVALASLAPGVWLLEVAEPNLIAEPSPVDVEPPEDPGSPVELAIEAEPAVTLAVTARNAGSDAQLFVDDAPVAEAGPRAQVPVLPGEHVVAAVAPGFARTEQTVDVGEGGADVELELEAGGEVEVRLACGGEPCAGALVASEAGEAMADAGGGALLDGLPPGPAWVMARWHAGLADERRLTGSVEVVAGERAHADFELDPVGGDATLTGRLVDPSGGPLTGRVTVRCGEAARVADAGPDGAFRLDGLPRGPCDLAAVALGRRRGVAHVSARAPGEVEVQVPATVASPRGEGGLDPVFRIDVVSDP